MSVISLVLVSLSSSAGSPLLVHCTLACVSSVLFCVWCLVSLVGALHFVPVSVLSCLVVLVSVLSFCIPVCVFVQFSVQFLHQVGRVRFPGEVGELAPYGGAPFLRWANSDDFVLYPRYG